MGEQAKYIGSCKERVINGRDGDFTLLAGSICLTDIDQKEVYTADNGKQYLRIDITKRKQIDNYGNSHSIKINTYKKPEGHVNDINADNMPQTNTNPSFSETDTSF